MLQFNTKLYQIYFNLGGFWNCFDLTNWGLFLLSLQYRDTGANKSTTRNVGVALRRIVNNDSSYKEAGDAITQCDWPGFESWRQATSGQTALSLDF